MLQVEERLSEARLSPSDELKRRIAGVPRAARRRRAIRTVLIAAAMVGGCSLVPPARDAVFRMFQAPNTVLFVSEDGDGVVTLSMSGGMMITSLPIPEYLPTGYEVMTNREIQSEVSDFSDLDPIIQWRRRRNDARIVVTTADDPASIAHARLDIESATPGGDHVPVRLGHGRSGVSGIVRLHKMDKDAVYVQWIEDDTVIYLLGTDEPRDVMIRIARSM